MSEKKDDSSKIDVSFDLGFGNIFKGLGNLVDMVSKMTETTEETLTRDESGSARSGEFKIKGLGDKARGIYGFSIRTAAGGIPHVEHFGNIRATDQGPEVAEVREPMVDIFDEGDEIIVVAELPGVNEQDIHVEIKDDILSLETEGERRYAKEILLSSPTQASSLCQTYRNGILELRIKKQSS